VTVAELQLLLSDLSKFLRASSAASAAGDLEYISARLQPFRAYKLKAFGDFLEQAEAYSRGALAPKPKGGRGGGGKKKADPAAIDQACNKVLELYSKAIDPSVTLDQIEAAVLALQELDPPTARLQEMARRMEYTQKLRSKAELIKALRQAIIGRKGAFDRPNA
jgi:hypothetical protein